jgi:hypothetical protein
MIRNAPRSLWFLAAMAALFPLTATSAEIVSVRLQNTGGVTQTQVPVTFGQVFKEGDVRADQTLTAHLSNGAAVALQVDKKATHGDGSLRHAVITALLPSLGVGGDTLTLSSASPATSAAAVSLGDLLATNNFDARADLNVGGTLYSASARDFLQNPPPKVWLNGPLVSEWIVGGPVRSPDGIAHPHLAAYFHVRAYAGLQRVRVDIVIENNWTLVGNPGNFTYDVNLSVGGTTVYSAVGLTHYHHARWHKVFWWGERPQVDVVFDKSYLQDTKAVPKYPPLSPSEAALSSFVSAIEPMQNGNLQKYMPETGANEAIGPLPRWTSLYLVSMDSRVKAATLANGDAGGSYSMHYRDENTGYPVSIETYPRLSEQGGTPALPMGTGNPLVHDTAHEPSIAYVPYLITGDYFYLEELQFWANYNLIWLSVDSRLESKGIVRRAQLRGQAWMLRELGRAAYITPDDHPLKSYFINRVNDNLAWYNQAYTDNPNANRLGIIENGTVYAYTNGLAMAPWQDDFFTYSVGHLFELGFSEAARLRDWKAKFSVSRMSDPDYCYIVGPSYSLVTRSTAYSGWDPPSDGNTFTTIGQVYRANYPTLTQSCGTKEYAAALAPPDQLAAGQLIGYSASASGYPANMRPALAMAVDAGLPNALTAWDRLVKSTNYTPVGTFADYPNWAVIPRTLAGPQISFTANPDSITPGASATLTWSAPDATGCTASGDWSGAKPVSGSQTISPTSDSVYTLSCDNENGTSGRSVAISIASNGSGGGGQAGGSVGSGGKSGAGAVEARDLLLAASFYVLRRARRRCSASIS